MRVREGGEVLQTIELDRGCFACMLGGADGTTLFMLAAEWRGMEHMAARPGPARSSSAGAGAGRRLAVNGRWSPVSGASHWPQAGQPGTVARLLTEAG